jgi:Tol biopolymer transport system component
MDWRMKIRIFCLVIFNVFFFELSAQRVPVLDQIKLPHNYYFREMYLPQLTSGPSSATWSPDGKDLIFSMKGSLWRQSVTSEEATQITEDVGYDYQPDWSPDGKYVVFVRYDGTSCELMLLDISSGDVKALTNNRSVNLEPRWSSDSKRIVFTSTKDSGHFLIYTAKLEGDQLAEIVCLTQDEKSNTPRYYYSPFNHNINPTWSRDGKSIYFITNKEIAHGTGDMVMMNWETKEIKTILHEETNWRTRPDISPDGTRIIYSSYLGRNWHQLWLLPAGGGYPMPLTYGDYDNTYPRWSPDGKRIAFISNRDGNTSLWVVNVFDGGHEQIKQTHLAYKTERTQLTINVRDEKGSLIPARVSVIDQQGKFHAPNSSWIHADDSRYPSQEQFETHYFHISGPVTISAPKGKIRIEVSHGPEYELLKTEIDTSPGSKTVDLVLRKQVPQSFGNWWSGDLHSHMNYGGHYKNTPENLVKQAEAENLNFLFNLIVNKEQRIPDVNYFSPKPDEASTDNVMLFHSQEFHTSFWGHLALLNLNDHLIIPDYSGYPKTAAESLFPNNSFIADRAHDQNGLVGYAHPFEISEVIPDQSSTLFNELPIDVALGKVDYYELIGFSDHKASEKVWYQLLNIGFKLPAGAGTDAMGNYASLRGPVGVNRVYVKGEGPLNKESFLQKITAGKSFVTNGPMLGFTVDGKNSGDSIEISSKGKTLSYSALLRSHAPIEHFEVIWNGEVIAKHTLKEGQTSADVTGTLKVKGSGWLLLRAWGEKGERDLPDLYPYATTNPIYIKSQSGNVQQKAAATYFLKWVNRIESKAKELTYRNEAEKETVMKDIQSAKVFYQNLLK